MHAPVPSGPPLNIRISSVSQTSFVLEWSPPLEERRNGLIAGYTVLLRWQTGQELLNTSRLSHSFTKLYSQTTYLCSVAAHTNAGMGPYAAITTTTARSNKVLSFPLALHIRQYSNDINAGYYYAPQITHWR